MGVQYWIDSYSIIFPSSKSISNLTIPQVVAQIKVFEQRSCRGYLWFYSDETDLAPSSYDSQNECIELHYNLKHMHAIMDMLRNEDSIYVYYKDPSSAHIGCGREPVGE